MPDRPVDRRGVLDQDIFYQESKNGTIFIAWRGRRLTTLKGPAANRFLGRIGGPDRRQAQLLMARITGNFRRGNERSSA